MSEQPGDFEMFFGKHKGSCLKDIPDDYLKWIASDKFVPRSDWAKKCQESAKALLGEVPDEIIVDEDVPAIVQGHAIYAGIGVR